MPWRTTDNSDSIVALGADVLARKRLTASPRPFHRDSAHSPEYWQTLIGGSNDSLLEPTRMGTPGLGMNGCCGTTVCVAVGRARGLDNCGTLPLLARGLGSCVAPLLATLVTGMGGDTLPPIVRGGKTSRRCWGGDVEFAGKDNLADGIARKAGGADCVPAIGGPTIRLATTLVGYRPEWFGDSVPPLPA